MLFFKKKDTENERYLPLIDDARNVDEIAASIKRNTINGRLFYSCGGFDSIDVIEGILLSYDCIDKSFVRELVNDLRQTRDDLYNTVDALNDVLNERAKDYEN